MAATTRTSAQFLGAAHAPNVPSSQDAQELGLQAGRHLGNLVDKERPSLGDLDKAWLRLESPGEGPFFMAEKLAFEQGLLQGGTVDGHERAVAAGAVVVDGTGHQLLAGAAAAAPRGPWLRSAPTALDHLHDACIAGLEPMRR